MKKHAATLLILMLVALTGLVNAQTRIKAQVPFDYVVKDKTLPAGECTIQVKGDGITVLWIASGGEGLFVHPNASQSAKPSAQTTLLFRRYGDRYFLAGIRRQGEDRGYEFPVSRLEGELRAQNIAEKIVTLLASAK